ncbi:glutamate-tRNA ligase [Laetiporus sulphureus 93-53]|uniref:glutamate--tRNA ligase n=1 Tax=Laetiporus sulphureus 93-53 TaxID=1314785 RepID=A0A165G1B4_9APHY|nr:glutamate-tRNA ligase [Laetiporus sulphureus 93-53]KZT09696.1 glutamate-tRNA ligase [Laetiporus sulphureus 93-53]
MTGTLVLSASASPFPYAAAAAATYTGKAELAFDESASGVTLELDGSKITAEDEVVRALAKAGGLSDDSEKTQAYFALAKKKLPTTTTFPEIVATLDSLDDHLAFRTFFVGHEISAADWIVWGALKGSVKIVGLLKNNKHPHLLRWFSHLESLETTQLVVSSLADAKSQKARSNKTAASFALGLQDAKMGEVVTRFPPEPSGYLHIGHAKAAMLNQYFAKMYNGKLLIRFDDTNPTKERTEFEETILEDLALLDVHGDAVSHTSDYFDELYELALQMIKKGKAYADDTEQMQMREERFHGIASKHRDDSVEDNLKHFAEMKAGTQEGVRWCLRAKMSVDNPNKAMRDPVIYRCNLLPHHRTGDKWKVYPTYDFACPIVDSLEGVTHALRTNEYRDRNPQYHWMIEALGLRKVHIWDFSRLNFIYTLLSKRKLHWFVDSGIVRGWDDPRFPTVRGIRRRGLTVEALRQFMLAQGPSQAIVSLEWDSLWTMNKKVIDPIAPRLWAIEKVDVVKVTVRGGPQVPEVKTLPKHKKNAEVGEKQTVFSSKVSIEQEDALSFEDQEEITLMDWGNAIVRSKKTNEDGLITDIEMELHLEGDFRKTKKKITWLAQPTDAHPLVDITLLDHDYLITKKKLEENDDVKDFVTPVSEFRADAVSDANVLALKKGDIIQFERKGYYIYDGINEGRREFIHIPDGRAASLASKAASAAPTPKEKADETGGSAAGEAFVAKSLDIPVDTKMYKVAPIYEKKETVPLVETKMYKVKNVYDS